jgi:hypothetical protein
MDEIQAKFFDTEQPCPPEIPDCIRLREEYLTELNKYKEQGLCTGCIERNLKYKYTTFILATTNV